MHSITLIKNSRPDSLFPLIIGLLAVLLPTCERPPSSEYPAFSDLTALTGKRFVAYVSPDRKSKPDTIVISWNFSGMMMQSINAEATVDSGGSWILLPEVLHDGGNQATLRWVPGDDTVHFSYFGEKECFIRISDTSSAVVIESDRFLILGPHPIILLAPRGGETFSLNDTVSINYQTNNDRISNIRVFFMHDEMTDWKEISETTLRTDDSNPPLRSFTTYFTPFIWDTLITNHHGAPIRFLLKDYNSPLPNSSIISDAITVQP
ncbi:MAG: hypothetical protein JXA18_00530 [Chitinispirillaceae bacterium]|nr:hypothetical protein [Chitinispirillaceae bacterium]